MGRLARSKRPLDVTLSVREEMSEGVLKAAQRTSPVYRETMLPMVLYYTAFGRAHDAQVQMHWRAEERAGRTQGREGQWHS